MELMRARRYALERGIATASRLSVRLPVRNVGVLRYMLEYFENNFPAD